MCVVKYYRMIAINTARAEKHRYKVETMAESLNYPTQYIVAGDRSVH